jgi:hypothetical protein
VVVAVNAYQIRESAKSNKVGTAALPFQPSPPGPGPGAIQQQQQQPPPQVQVQRAPSSRNLEPA